MKILHANRTSGMRTKRRFTLIELLVVMFIVVVLLGIMGGALQSGRGDLKLKAAVRMMNAQLSRARSLAVQNRKNVTVDFTGSSDYYCLVDHNNVEIADTRVYWESGVVHPAFSNITFNSRGATTGAVAAMQLAVPDKEGKFDTGKSAHYYEISVNQYTGRATTEFHED